MSIGLVIASKGSRIPDCCSISVIICHPLQRSISDSPKLEKGASLVTEVDAGTSTYVEH